METLIAMKDITVTQEAQAREALAPDVISEYATALAEGSEFLPAVVFYDGISYWLADGFHRYYAHDKVGKTEILCEIREGGLRDAILYAVGANTMHGLRRTNADKRRAVGILLADPEWSQWSDREISRRCDVHHNTVADVREKVTGDLASEAENSNENNEPVFCDPPENIPGPVERKANEIAGKGGTPRFYEDKHGNVSVMDVSGVGDDGKHDLPMPTEQLPWKRDDCGELSEIDKLKVRIAELEEHLSEMADNMEDDQERLAIFERISESGDDVAGALKEVERYREQDRIAQERINGLMNEKNEAIRAAKRWKRKYEEAVKGV